MELAATETFLSSPMGKSIISVDYNTARKPCFLLRSVDGKYSIKLDAAEISIPDSWRLNLPQANWVSESEILLWPVTTPDARSLGAIMDLGSHDLVDIGLPIKLFASGGVIATIYSESFSYPGRDAPPNTDIMTIYSYDALTGLDKKSRIADILRKDYSEELFFEVVHAVIDPLAGRVWFIADETEILWCYDYAGGHLRRTNLGLSFRKVVVLTCSGDKVSVIFRDVGRIWARIFRVSGRAAIELDGDMPIALSDLSRAILLEIDPNDPYLVGYSNNQITLVRQGKVTLIMIGAG